MAIYPEIINNRMVTYQGINDYNQILIHEIPRMGRNNDFTGNINLAWGCNNQANDTDFSFLFGEGNQIKEENPEISGTGSCHFLFGKNNLVHRSNGHGFTFGEGLSVMSNGERVNITDIYKSIFLCGQYNALHDGTSYENAAFVIGNGAGEDIYDTETETWTTYNRKNLLQLDYNGKLRIIGDGGIEYGENMGNSVLSNAGDYGVAIGLGVNNTGDYACVFGYQVTNAGKYSLINGETINNNKSNGCNIICGKTIYNDSLYNLIIGDNIGQDTKKIQSNYSLNIGSYIENTGAYSIVFGKGISGSRLTNQADYSFVFGESNANLTARSLVFGVNNHTYMSEISDDIGNPTESFQHLIIGTSNQLYRTHGHAFLMGTGLVVSSHCDEDKSYLSTYVLGQYNLYDGVSYKNAAVVIGNGSGTGTRSNLLQLDYDGRLKLYNPTTKTATSLIQWDRWHWSEDHSQSTKLCLATYALESSIIYPANQSTNIGVYTAARDQVLNINRYPDGYYYQSLSDEGDKYWPATHYKFYAGSSDTYAKITCQNVLVPQEEYDLTLTNTFDISDLDITGFDELKYQSSYSTFALPKSLPNGLYLFTLESYLAKNQTSTWLAPQIYLSSVVSIENNQIMSPDSGRIQYYPYEIQTINSLFKVEYWETKIECKFCLRIATDMEATFACSNLEKNPPKARLIPLKLYI